MNLKELMDVSDEGAKHTAKVMTIATALSENLEGMVAIIRDQLTGNERDLAMAGLGAMIEARRGEDEEISEEGKQDESV